MRNGLILGLFPLLIGILQHSSNISHAYSPISLNIEVINHMDQFSLLDVDFAFLQECPQLSSLNVPTAILVHLFSEIQNGQVVLVCVIEQIIQALLHNLRQFA